MPAAAVIPAPIAYIKVVAVKKLVVELLYVPGSGFGQAVVRASACKPGPAFTGRPGE